ncbi:MAG: hypothetical protein IJG68_00715 [Bacilli bacterium]|nr:hypothetical protein [Bacilli bacterium]
MRRTKRSKKQIIIGIISSIVLVLTIGYSFLSLNLRISGLAHIGAVWNIYFDNIVINQDSVSLSVGDIEPEIDEDNDCKINYKVTLTPGDFYEFTFDIVNSGTIDGMISDIITRLNNDATATLPSYIDYTVSYSDDVVLETNQQLLAGTTETLKVKVEFKDEENVPESETLPLSFEQPYIKKTNAGTKVKHPQPLYNVLQDEANSGSGLAVQYTGQHHDSFTEEPSKNIYHWYASNANNANTIRTKNNVIFANHCWQMIRTTDTGGVKLLYNGEVDNNQCLDTRGTHFGYGGKDSIYLSRNYWYGTDYYYDEEDNKFHLTGTIEQLSWNNNTYQNIIGKYTCISSNRDDSCSKLYYVDNYSSSNYAYGFYLVSDAVYSQYGKLPFNYTDTSMSDIGYMYGEKYLYKKMNNYGYINLYTNNTSLFTSISLSSYSQMWVADSISYDNSNNTYSLTNPLNVTPSTDYSSLVGKYSFFNSDVSYVSTSIKYIAYTNSANMYYITLSGGEDISSKEPLVYGDSIVKNNNGSYTIQGYSNYTYLDIASGISNKYSCDNGGITCTNPKLITSLSYSSNSYINLSDQILIAKNHNELTLTDYILVSYYDLLHNTDDYSDYILSCGNTDYICTDNNLIAIHDISNNRIRYINNRYFGTNAIWDGQKYILQNTIGVENYYNYDALSNHHFMCLNKGTKECTTLLYLFSIDDDTYNQAFRYYYIELNNGITSINSVINSMFQNVHNSPMKTGIEFWYQKYMSLYDTYIEDIIYCNNRYIIQKGAWDETGEEKMNSRFAFMNYSGNTNFSCPNITDQFSVANNLAPSTYKVGLLTKPELIVMGNNTIMKSGGSFSLMNPYGYAAYNGAYITVVASNGSYFIDSGMNNDYHSSSNNGVRPSISLIPGIMFTDGDGSKEHPYIIKTNL